MKKDHLGFRLLALILAAALLLSACPAAAGDAAPALQPGPWACADGSTLTFSGGGTGRYVNKNGKEFDVS